MESELLISPDESQMKLMQEHIGENPEKFEHQLSLFQQWLEYQKHLPQIYSKHFLSHFLRTSKMNLEKAKGKFEKYCYLQQTHEIFFKNRPAMLDGDLRILDAINIFPLPELTPEGYRITIAKFNNVDKYELATWCSYITLMGDYRLHTDTFYVGEILIVDMVLMRLQLYSQLFTPTLLHFLKMGIQGYPCRLKQIIIISRNPIAERGINLCKTVLPEKVKNRFSLISSYADLHKYIPEKYLPSDYNGTQKSFSDFTNGWKELMVKNAALFKHISETKPLGPIPKHITKYDDTLGVDGSFRKLNID